VECIQRTRYTTTTTTTTTNDNIGNDIDDDIRPNGDTSSSPGITAVARKVFGRTGETIIGLLLVILIEATLVSQISRAGLMFADHYKIACAISSISIAALVFGPKKSGIQVATKANSFLTTCFLLSAAAVFASGYPSADWSRLGTFGITAGSTAATATATAVTNHWSMLPDAIPTFLQLLVYGEIVPAVCQLLNYNIRSIRMAITAGSFMTLCLQVGWSALGISLVDAATTTTTTTAAVAMDPVNVLLAQGGLVKFPLLCLAATAILTTILGSYLALLSTVNDFFRKFQNGIENDTMNDTGTKGVVPVRHECSSSSSSSRNDDDDDDSENSWQKRLGIASIITLPALSIASTSPTIFLAAIDFAGSYPVLLLWGVAPPLIALVQRHRSRNNSSGSGSSNTSSTGISEAGPSSWLVTLASVSIGMVLWNAQQDFMSMFKKFL
jgi:hypothetical protein